MPVVRACIVLLASLLISTSAFAQNFGDGVLGWATIPGPTQGQWSYFATPTEACKWQYDAYKPINTPSWFLGYKDTPYYWSNKQCDWYPYGPGISPFPANTFFYCASGYIAVEPGRCVPNNLPTSGACSTNNGALPSPMTGKPIEILTGSKVFRRNDFFTSDHSIEISRWFTSGGYGGVTTGYYSARAPLGFGNWRASFSIHMTISDYNYYGDWLVNLPSGRAVSFRRNADGSFTADTYASTAFAATDVKLAFVGAWPASPSAMMSAPTTWTVTDEDDNVWTLQTHLDAELGNYSVAMPVSMVDRLGLVRTFTYGSSGEITSISDSSGKTVSLSWLYSDPSTLGITGRTKYPVAISEADLPDGSKIMYSYTSMGQPATGLLWPDALTKVEFLDPSGVLQDAESYNYGDSRFPWFVTDILDKNGVTRWSVTYDSSGRAVTSQGPSGAFATFVSYAPFASSFTRTVTNALGQQTVYQYNSIGLNDNAKLIGVNGQVSANCPASSSGFTYDNNPFITSETDEEGRVTGYTRNSRGLPTQIVEAQGTSSARTTNITWHPTLGIPTEIVAPGRTTDFTYTSAP